MNNYNFNSIDNLEIPDLWVDKAIEFAKNKKPVSVIKTTKTLAFVASMVLVCGISVMMFLLVGKNEPPLAPTVNQTDASVCDDASESKGSKESEKKHDETQNSTDATTSCFETIEPSEQSVQPTKKPSDSQKPINPQPTTPSDVEYPTDPIEKPSETVVEQPSQPPIDIPSQPPMDIPDTSNIFISTTIYEHLVLDDKKIYCKVYNENGALLGDLNVFSEQHLTELSYMSYYTAYYYPYRYSLITKSGNYTFVFYNSSGEEAGVITKFLENYS